MVRDRRHRLLRTRALTFAVTAMCSLLLAACAAPDPPATSPFADPSTPAPQSSETAETPVPLPTFSPTPMNTELTPTPSPSLDADAERAAGDAISHLADWTGEAETEFRVMEVEAVEWSSGCLGVDIPGSACTMAIVPGFRIELTHAGQPDGPPYLVHASRTGRYVWMPAMESVRTIAEIEGNVVRFEPARNDEMGHQHRVVAGSFVERPLADLGPGERVHIAITWPLPGDDHGLVVWMVEPIE